MLFPIWIYNDFSCVIWLEHNIANDNIFTYFKIGLYRDISLLLEISINKLEFFAAYLTNHYSNEWVFVRILSIVDELAIIYLIYRDMTMSLNRYFHHYNSITLVLWYFDFYWIVHVTLTNFADTYTLIKLLKVFDGHPESAIIRINKFNFLLQSWSPKGWLVSPISLPFFITPWISYLNNPRYLLGIWPHQFPRI